MPEIPESRAFKNRQDWRRWLQRNHDSKKELWLIIYKKHTGKPSIRLDEAVEEALCFGWIDGKLRRIDGEKHALRFTPRKAGSVWSETNIERVNRLTRAGKMTKIGLEKFRNAKTDPMFKILRRDFEIPEFITDALKSNDKAWRTFDALPPSRKKQYVYWIASAKREETRNKRLEETIKRCSSNRKHIWEEYFQQ